MKHELIFQEVHELAVAHGLDWFNEFLHLDQNPLNGEVLKYENAWMFMRNGEVFIPDEKSLWRNSIVISSYGEVRFTPDFDGDLNACMNHLKIMAKHFKERGL